MAQTTFRLAVSKQDTPLSDGGPSASPASTPGKSNSPNTGFLTQDGTVNKDVLGVVTSPIVSGAFIFAGFILLLVLIAKIKKNKQASFNASLSKKHYTTTILAFATFLLFAAGVGGTISRFMGVEAENNINYEDITTSGTVPLSIVEKKDDYKIYCGEDTVTIKIATENGYLLYAKNDNSGNLYNETNPASNIQSIDDWATLSNNTWGFKTDKETYAEITNLGQYKPLHLGEGVIAANYEATPAGEQIKVNYCARVAVDADDANYSSSVTYGIITLDSDNIAFVDGIDYDSLDDYDGDTLTNRKESVYGTNVSIEDTDLDGLSDPEEINTYGTNPLVADTDNDNISDYGEIAMSLNPKKTDSMGDGVQDGNRTLSYTIEDEDSGVSIALTGSGDLPASRIVVNDDVSDVENSNINLYSLATGANITSATITIPYDIEDLEEEVGATVSEDELVIAKYDSEEDELTTIPSTLNTTNNTIAAVMSDLDAQYIIADKDTEATEETVIEEVYGSVVNGGTIGDDDILGAGVLSKVVSKATAKTQTTKQAQTTDCLTSTNGCDSGFRAGKDGLAFGNFTFYDHDDKYFAGVCSGISTFAKLYHEGKVTGGDYYYYNFKYYYNLDGLLASQKTLYRYTTPITDNDIAAVAYERIEELKPDAFNVVKNEKAVVMAVRHARSIYGDATNDSNSSAIQYYATSLPGLERIDPNIKIINANEYLKMMKDALSAQPKGRSVLAASGIYLLGLVRVGSHSMNIESIKQKSVNKTLGTTTYTIKYYDSGYSNKDKTATMICGQKIGCKAYAIFAGVAENILPATTSILGTPLFISDEIIFNLFSASSPYKTKPN